MFDVELGNIDCWDETKFVDACYVSQGIHNDDDELFQPRQDSDKVLNPSIL